LPTQHVLYFGIQAKKNKLDAAGASKSGHANIAEIHAQIMMMPKALALLNTARHRNYDLLGPIFQKISPRSVLRPGRSDSKLPFRTPT
jgi:hypothetical protein